MAYVLPTRFSSSPISQIRRLSMKYTTLIFFTTSAIGLLSTQAINATNWPNKPIRLLIPFPTGGGTDAMARMLCPRLTEATGQAWIVDNRGGAAGNIAAEITAHSAADGYTLLMGFSTVMTVNKSLYPKAQFDPIKDFDPIIHMAASAYMLTVHPSVAANSVNALVALAKAKPDSLNFASAGVASPLHLAGELFKNRAGIQITHVPYKGGGPATASVLAGESQLVFGSMTSSLPHVKNNKLRALAVTGLTRSTLVPELPTMNESGFQGFDVTSWQSLVAPVGTDKAIIARIHTETSKALATSEITKLFHNIGYDVTDTTPEALGKIIKNESKMWEKIIREAKIKPD